MKTVFAICHAVGPRKLCSWQKGLGCWCPEVCIVSSAWRFKQTNLKHRGVPKTPHLYSPLSPQPSKARGVEAAQAQLMLMIGNELLSLEQNSATCHTHYPHPTEGAAPSTDSQFGRRPTHNLLQRRDRTMMMEVPSQASLNLPCAKDRQAMAQHSFSRELSHYKDMFAGAKTNMQTQDF